MRSSSLVRSGRRKRVALLMARSHSSSVRKSGLTPPEVSLLSRSPVVAVIVSAISSAATLASACAARNSACAARNSACAARNSASAARASAAAARASAIATAAAPSSMPARVRSWAHTEVAGAAKARHSREKATNHTRPALCVFGEFKWSSQHLESEELRWEQESVDELIVRDALRCGRPIVHRWGGGSIGSDSGRRLRAGCRAGMLGWWRVCRRRSARGGSARMAGCRQANWPRCRGAICRSANEKRSRSCTLRASGFVRLRGGSADVHRRSRGNCVGTLRPAVTTCSIEPQLPSGTPTGAPRRPKVAKLAANNKLRQYVQDGLAGVITATDGTSVPGPDVRWIGRRHGRHQERRWARSWSPEQIAHRLRVDFSRG